MTATKYAEHDQRHECQKEFRGGGQEIGNNKIVEHVGYRLLDLANGDVTQQVIDRSVHDFRERLRV